MILLDENLESPKLYTVSYDDLVNLKQYLPAIIRQIDFLQPCSAQPFICRDSCGQNPVCFIIYRPTQSSSIVYVYVVNRDYLLDKKGKRYSFDEIHDVSIKEEAYGIHIEYGFASERVCVFAPINSVSYESIVNKLSMMDIFKNTVTRSMIGY